MWLWQEHRQAVRVDARREICEALAAVLAGLDLAMSKAHDAQLSENFEMELEMRREATRKELNRLKRSIR